MLKIRLQRTGRINQPTYRVVVLEHARSTKSNRIVEQVGTYNPRTKERVINTDRVKYWLSVGAQASGTMHNMLITVGIISGKKINVLPKKTAPVKTDAEAATPIAA
jgi:small subunit ribosomal protein S16